MIHNLYMVESRWMKMVFMLHYSQQYFNITFPLKLKADSWDLSRYSPQNEEITHEDVTFLCGGPYSLEE